MIAKLHNAPLKLQIKLVPFPGPKRKMIPPPANMTRSFINPKDRAAEIARKRREAEELRHKRDEERLRRIEERMANALKRKQMTLDEKSSKTKSEADRLREVNKRRLEHDNLERQRIQASCLGNAFSPETLGGVLQLKL